MSSECNNIKLDIQNDKSEVVCAMCKKCLITANHDVCVLTYVNDMNSCGKKQKANVLNVTNQKKHQPTIKKPKKLGSKERLASPKPSKLRTCLRWSPIRIIFDLKGKIIASSKSKCQSDIFVGRLNLFMFLGTVRFGNDHVAAILGYGDLQRNTCYVRNLERVDLLKGNRTTNLYTINLHEMASASLIFLIARATSTKSWLWNQRLSHLNFDTINDLAKNDLVIGLLKFKYHKEHLCPSCEQGKSKKASHPPKLVLSSKQRLHHIHLDLGGPMRVESINRKHYILVIVDDYSSYTWVHFLRSKDEAPDVIKTFLKKITVLLQAPVIIVRTDNDTEFKNQVLQEYFDSVGIYHQTSFVRTPQQNGVMKRKNRMLVEAARTMLIFSCALLFLWAEVISIACYTQNRSIIHRRFNKTPYKLINGKKLAISFLYVFGALCYPKNDCEDLGKLGAKAMYDDYIRGQSSVTTRTSPAAQAHQDVDEHKPQPQHAQQQDDQARLQPKIVADKDSNAMLDGNTFVNPFANPSTDSAKSSSHYLRTDGDMCMYALTVSTMEPSNVKHAMTDPAWIDSMQEELLQFKQLDVWELVPLPDNIKALTLKWLFKNKHDEENTIINKKTRMVVRGYRLEEGIDLEESFTLVARMEAIKIFLAYATHKLFIVFQIDMKTAFLHGTLKEDMYVCQPEGFIDADHPSHVYKLKKALYGLKTPMEIKDKLDLDKNRTLVDATKYRSMIGALMYLTSSRPDIIHATCLCARYQAKPTEKHLKYVKRIFPYLWGTINMGLWYTKDFGFELTEFSDADYARCKDTFKSTSGGLRFLGEKLVSWSSKKQDCTSLSTAKVEYVSLSACCAQVI
ncbi:retrovirus-related pol polyprotein from transposon TNT 1-94 [Tanacetum coccineum]